MGGIFGKANNHDDAIRRMEESHARRVGEAEAKYNQQLQQMTNASEEQRHKMQAEFNAQQERLAQELDETRARYEARIEALAQSMQEAEQNVANLTAELQKPIKDRQAKVDFVNSLHLKIHTKSKLLLVGPKGMGKSTFMWLMNRGEKPKQTFSDGTVDILQLQGFVDSIGLRGWTPEDLAKLLVLLIYDGIPRDLIIFGNDRIDLPVTSLGLVGITAPMIVIMSSDFWKNLQPQRSSKPTIHLLEDGNGVRKVTPVEDLEKVYNLPVYDDIKALGLGLPITHHDNIEYIVAERERAGVHPFQHLLDLLGDEFVTTMENSDNTLEALFRFIYVFEKKYNKNRLKFMNLATLQDFSVLT